MCTQREYAAGITKSRLQMFADECPHPPQDLFTDEVDSGRCMGSICASCLQSVWYRRYVSASVPHVFSRSGIVGMFQRVS